MAKDTAPKKRLTKAERERLAKAEQDRAALTAEIAGNEAEIARLRAELNTERVVTEGKILGIRAYAAHFEESMIDLAKKLIAAGYSHEEAMRVVRPILPRFKEGLRRCADVIETKVREHLAQEGRTSA